MCIWYAISFISSICKPLSLSRYQGQCHKFVKGKDYLYDYSKCLYECICMITSYSVVQNWSCSTYVHALCMNLFVLKGTVSNINIFGSFKNSIRAFCPWKDGIALFNYLVVEFLKRKPFAASMKKKTIYS